MEKYGSGDGLILESDGQTSSEEKFFESNKCAWNWVITCNILDQNFLTG